MNRYAQRSIDKIRPVQLTYGIYEYAAGSVLIEVGKTKVLCSVMYQEGVPHFLRGSGTGWLTAEYAMLPASTQSRMDRDSIKSKNGRAIEISRLIGRSLRAVIDLKSLGEKTIMIDCDVLQADGGTRSAAITGAYCALKMAEQKLLSNKKVSKPFVTDQLAAISVGIKDGVILLDLDCDEDKTIDADFNFVLTRSGNVVEVQGSSEQDPIAWDLVVGMKAAADQGVTQLFDCIDTVNQSVPTVLLAQDFAQHTQGL